MRAARRWGDAARRRRLEREAFEEAERRRTIAEVEYARSAPDRERARLRAEEEARSRARAQQRREDARASALLHYRYYTAKLGGDWFPKGEFDQYVERFMGDQHPAEVVEQRGRDLLATFERQLVDRHPPRRETNVEVLHAWYRREEERISALPLKQSAIDVHLINLRRRFEALVDDHLSESQP